ncbi:MAG: RagB/SusD family nutrient uptake outer membrane protein [Bacteroidales bacterium]|nr:RagB/SusD family nutrient uptake outer membrane protein [Bacteroidales bacterium]
MKIYNIIKGLTAIAAAFAFASCEKFLDRPAEDNYNVSNFYKTDEQCEQGVNYLYNSPWYDFQRGFIKIGEVMSGNMYWGSSPYMDFSTNGTDQDLVNMSYSLWAVNGHANTVIDNILNASGPSQAAKSKYIGEALTWKAFAYFFMVRTFGEVPIIHNNTDLLNSGGYNTVTKVERADVYEYIIMTLEKAMDLLPKKTSGFANYERIDYYAAEALLAKVYLTKAGLSGSLNQDDLKQAAKYAKDVIDHSGRTLLPVYSDLFRLSGFNATGECLISWEWSVGRNPWTQQNTLQSDLAMVGFGDQGDCWGGWGGPSVDLGDAFGVSAVQNPAERVGEKDSRRKATMMLPGDKYDYFWTDRGGFDYLRFIYDTEYGKGGPGGSMQCQTGSNNVKHLYGDNYDHEQAGLGTPQNMAYQLPTHLLRLADVYLIYAEASLLTGNAPAALEYINYVRERAGVDPLASVTFDDIWKERRLELAGEGDRWYDYVRRSYYDMDACIAELKAQRRSHWDGLDDVWKAYIGDAFDYSGTWDASSVEYNNAEDNPNVTASSFTLPFPTEDVVFNKNMASDAVASHVDVREEYHYNF